MPGPDPSGERVFLGLGGNIGDPARLIPEALRRLAATGTTRLVAVSSLYRTPPWGDVDQPEFLNAVAEIRTELSPMDLLAACLAVEAELKRRRTVRWGPRTIDIDIIAFGERRIAQEGLVIPHPRLAARAFVLVPLAEIAPDLVIEGATVADLAAAADRTGIIPVATPQEWMPGIAGSRA